MCAIEFVCKMSVHCSCCNALIKSLFRLRIDDIVYICLHLFLVDLFEKRCVYLFVLGGLPRSVQRAPQR